MKKFLVYLQYILPQYFITCIFGFLANIKIPFLKNFFIRTFIKLYEIDLTTAQNEDIISYPSFNDFFIRQLKPALRPISNLTHGIVSPIDGTMTQFGQIQQNQLVQVKQSYFDLETLLGGDTQLAQQFYDGSFATFYLAPHDYHRVHMPLSGELQKTIFVPGKLFSVNHMTAILIPNIYSRNERFISLFTTEAGSMVVILVGALIVGSIQTVWMKESIRSKKILTSIPREKLYLAKGSELGQFKIGSSVILLFTKNKISWESGFFSDSCVQYGQLIGKMIV